jgi:hypothetical protein
MMSKDKAEGEEKRGRGRPQKPPTDTVRAPLEICDMLALIAGQEINGWKSTADILGDPNCTLKDWLMPYYLKAVDKAVKRSEQIKKRK